MTMHSSWSLKYLPLMAFFKVAAILGKMASLSYQFRCRQHLFGGSMSKEELMVIYQHSAVYRYLVSWRFHRIRQQQIHALRD